MYYVGLDVHYRTSTYCILNADGRDHLVGLRSWGLRDEDLVKVTGAGPNVIAWRPGIGQRRINVWKSREKIPQSPQKNTGHL
jgi:hypothetical protein